MLSQNAKRLMIVHNFSGILRIMISTFLSIFLFKEGGYIPLILFNSIQYALLPFLYCVFARRVKFKKLLVLFRIGIFLSFLFSVFLVLFQNILPDIIIIAAIFYGIALSFYWYAYNLLIYHFNDLDQRIRYLGYSKALDKVINIITPIVLGSFIAVGSYDTLFLVMMVMMALLFFYSLKLEIQVKDPNPLHLKSYYS